MEKTALMRSTFRKSINNRNFKRNMYRYIMVAPALIAVAVFSYLPFAGVSIAFMDFDIIKGFRGSEWVGFKNFIELFKAPDFLKVVVRTLGYSSVLIFVTFPLPIIFALLFNELENKAFKRVAQTMTYLPHFLSMITVVGLFSTTLSLSGPVNTILAKLYGEAYERKNIMLDSKYFLWIIFSANLWKELGWMSIIYLAAITGVDKSLYESASVDGCGRFKQIWYVTIPGILGTIIIQLLISVGSVFNVGFELVYGFQNLYTQTDTEVISTLIYRQGIINGDYSFATAFGLTQGIVSLTILYFANLLSKKVFQVSIW